MPDPEGLQPVLDAATQAAGVSDWPTAEKCLRLALRMQEVAVGPAHPDLANTLNNLAVVCEVSGQLAEAEVCYRKALAIASATFPADHPMVATGRENLRQFCEAHDVPLDLPSAPAAPAIQEVAAPPPEAESVRPVVHDPSAPLLQSVDPAPIRLQPARSIAPPPRVPPVARANRPHESRRWVLVAAGAIVVLALAVVAAMRSLGGDETAVQPPSAATVASGPGRSATSAVSGRGTPSRPTRAAATASTTHVVDARLCARLSTTGSEWTCTPAAMPAGAGQLTFYTRITSPVDTEVEHRWSRGNELRQSGTLRVRANLVAGYRTYSRHTIGSDSAGNWRIELRGRSGELLHQEQFVVR